MIFLQLDLTFRSVRLKLEVRLVDILTSDQSCKHCHCYACANLTSNLTRENDNEAALFLNLLVVGLFFRELLSLSQHVSLVLQAITGGGCCVHPSCLCPAKISPMQLSLFVSLCKQLNLLHHNSERKRPVGRGPNWLQVTWC